MTARLLRLAVLATVALVLARVAPGGDKKPTPKKQFTAREVAFFEKDVLPILKANCFKCHGNGKPRGSLHLNSRAAVLTGGDTGPAVSLDRPDESLLLKAINYRDGLEMPPKGKLPQKDIDTLTRWVKAGLPWTPGTATTQTPKHQGGAVTEESRNYWAYKPVQRPAVPAVKERAWVANPIDAFILARLEAKGLKPNPPAGRVALVRRAYYDLTGLPPTPEEVDAFVNDRSPRAYENLLDRLLASPHYGEKWGRHWLDLVRYAETNGYERDGPKPFAWRFRDYVIKSFNADKPYDRFVKEQLAGDEIDRNDADAITATGYYRLGLWDDEPADPAQARADETDDIVATTAQVFLGMTMNCARCHDHKIDPIPQKDYYRLAAFFGDVRLFAESRNSAARAHLTDVSPPQERAVYEGELRRRQDRMTELQGAMRKIEDEAIRKMPAADQRAAEGAGRPQVLRKLRRFLTAEQSATYRKLREEFIALRRKPNPSHGLALSVNECLVTPPPTHVLIRGSPHSPGVKVEPGFPTVLARSAPTIPAPARGARSSGRRSVLAKWIVSRDNPTTARVLANRLWQHHFGRGIVTSTNDFGKFGTPPTHPELLNWLADELMRGGWKLKRMHKLLMMSNTYRMSSAGSAAGLKADPDNALFWRFNLRRLTAEEVRDSILAVSGRLNLKMGGPSIYPPIPREVLAGQSVPGQGWHTSPPAEAARRSVYVHVKRSLLVPVLSQHDQADTDSSCPVRYTTTVPTQALGMLNGQFTNEQAAAFARRLEREAPGDLEKQVRRAIRLSTGRVPTDSEVKKDAAFTRASGLRQYCLLILNTNEFIYLD
jgi:mono/diheme cytochrome c family protein